MSEVEAAFEKLKVSLCAATILAYPKPGKEFIVDTSNFGMGGVLSQAQDGQEHIIACFSTVLNKVQINYCII
jgi:hypothetical protein